MKHSIPLQQHDAHLDHLSAEVSKGKLDLIVLRYLARRLHLILRQLDSPTTQREPLIYLLPERRGRIHRAVIYKYQELSLERRFTFVGFVSRKQKNLCSSVKRDVQMVDQKLIKDLVGSPGILSYSSLELRNGDWSNLVVMSDANAKAQIKGTLTHAYAAYQLAHRYYEWIRLHNGILAEGLDHTEMLLQRTKYYTFQETQPRPTLFERTYETHFLGRPALSRAEYVYS